jgi:hypothetical protein
MVNTEAPAEIEPWEREQPNLEIRERDRAYEVQPEAVHRETQPELDSEVLAAELAESQGESQPAMDWRPPPESPPGSAAESEEMPPPPDLFPMDWEMANAVMAAVADPAVAKVLANVPPVAEAGDRESPTAASESPPVQAVEESAPPAGVTGDAIPPVVSVERPTYIIPPLASTEGETVYMITIQLRPSEDKVRDNIRIRQIYGTLITYPGKDRFAFHLFERGRGYLIEFPNFTTGLCPELISRLKAFLPAEQVRIEPITFQ